MSPWKRVEHIGDATLYLGDCLEILPHIGEVDAVVTDPPYGVGLAAKNHKWFRTTGSGYISFEDSESEVERVAVSAINFCLRIAKRAAVTPGTECLMKYPQPADIGCVFNSSGTGSGRWGFKCSTPVLFYGSCPYTEMRKGRRPNSWQQHENDYSDKNDHPCPKPIGMMQWLVNRVSFEGHLIADPFMGSGTTGVACANLGRKFIGIEIEERYFDIACKRIAAAYAQGRLFE